MYGGSGPPCTATHIVYCIAIRLYVLVGFMRVVTVSPWSCGRDVSTVSTINVRCVICFKKRLLIIDPVCGVWCVRANKPEGAVQGSRVNHVESGGPAKMAN